MMVYKKKIKKDDKKSSNKKNKFPLFGLIFIIVAMGFFLFFLNIFDFNMTGFAIFSSANSSDFNEGTYSNILWNGSAVVLSSGQTSGNYISKVFDAGNIAIWNNLSWQGNLQTKEYIFAADNQADVWKS